MWPVLWITPAEQLALPWATINSCVTEYGRSVFKNQVPYLMKLEISATPPLPFPLTILNEEEVFLPE